MDKKLEERFDSVFEYLGQLSLNIILLIAYFNFADQYEYLFFSATIASSFAKEYLNRYSFSDRNIHWSAFSVLLYLFSGMLQIILFAKYAV